MTDTQKTNKPRKDNRLRKKKKGQKISTEQALAQVFALKSKRLLRKQEKEKIIDNCDNPEISNYIDMIDKQLSAKELKFIELYLSGEYTKEKAMKAAGYNLLSNHYCLIIAARIIIKYEQTMGDHQKIMREMGYGEVKILQLLIDSAEKAKSETVKLNARIALAKCLGIQKEVLEAIHGVQIVMGVAPVLPGAGAGQEEEAIDIEPLPIKVLSITK
jgi:hypothetical protein